MNFVEITEDDHWIWKGHQNPQNKYGEFELNNKKRTAHSIVLEEMLGRKIEAGKLTRHLCKAKLCCSPDHLVEGTYSENQLDRIRDGTMISKLNEYQVINIRTDTRAHKVIAEEYGVSQPLISLIKARKVWKWLN